MVIFRSKKDELGNRKVYPITGRGATRGPNRQEIAYLGALAAEGAEGENLRLGALDFMQSANILIAQLSELEGIMEAEGAPPEEMAQIDQAIGLLLSAQNDIASLGTATFAEMEAAMARVREQYSKASAIISEVKASLPDGSPEAGSLSLANEEAATSLLDLEGDFRTYGDAMTDAVTPSSPSDFVPHISPEEAQANEEWHQEQIAFDKENESPSMGVPNEGWHEQQIAYDQEEAGGDPGPAPLSEDVSYSEPKEPMKTYRLFPFDMIDKKKDEDDDGDSEGDENESL